MRWEFLTSLAAGGRADAAAIDAALALDNTQTGQLAAATAHAAIPTAAAKAATWESVVVRGDGANSIQRAAIAGFTKVWDTYPAGTVCGRVLCRDRAGLGGEVL